MGHKGITSQATQEAYKPGLPAEPPGGCEPARPRLSAWLSGLVPPSGTEVVLNGSPSRRWERAARPHGLRRCRPLRRDRRGLPSVVLAALLVGMTSAVAHASALHGSLTQLPGDAGCVSNSGTDPLGTPPGACALGHGLNFPGEVAASPDGRSVYVASGDDSTGTGGSVAVFARNPASGALTQLAGSSGCVSGSGASPCAKVDGLPAGQKALTVSPDGRNVYVVSSFGSDSGGALAVFTRNGATGALSQLPGGAGCLRVVVTGSTCAQARAMSEPYSVYGSRDGRNVYVASFASSAVAVFARNPATGALTQLPGTAGCVSEDGSDSVGGTCVDGKALSGALSVTGTDDGRSVYAGASNGAAVAVFARDTASGALLQLPGDAGCISETATDPFDTTASTCARGKALAGPSVAVSPDGRSVYVIAQAEDAVAIFARAAASGVLTQLPGGAGCISETGAGPCTKGKALSSAPYSMIVSPDGRSVYVSTLFDGAVAVFTRDAASGGLTQLAGDAGCVSETGAGPCAHAKGIGNAASVIVSTDGRNVYVASGGGDDVAVFVRQP